MDIEQVSTATLTNFGNDAILSGKHQIHFRFVDIRASGLSGMTAFERRQRILGLLRERPGIRVPELARLLEVSQGTIRNDLRALEKAGELTRVRGGAVVRDGRDFISPAFGARAEVNATAKKRIARWAADMVEDGDSVLLDSSSTVFHIAPFLLDRSNLTIITNGIEVAYALAENPTHTIILIGGVLRPDRALTVGYLGEKILENLHIKTALVSCSGFSVETGLTQVDIQEAQLKSRMIASAERVVALIDSTKFGKVDLTPFASVEQVSHILTDSDLAPLYIDDIRQTCANLTVCGENTTSTYTPCSQEIPHYKIGFANLGEDMSFPVDVRRGLEQAAQGVSNIDLILADNQLSGKVALRVADRLIAEGVDLVIEYQIDEKVGGLLMDKFKQADVPVIAVDIPMVGATYFGVDHYRAGRMAGVALGTWIAAHWDGSFDRLIVLEEQRPGALVAARIQGQLDGLQSIVGEISPARTIRLDSGNTSEISQTNMHGGPGAIAQRAPAGRDPFQRRRRCRGHQRRPRGRPGGGCGHCGPRGRQDRAQGNPPSRVATHRFCRLLARAVRPETD